MTSSSCCLSVLLLRICPVLLPVGVEDAVVLPADEVGVELAAEGHAVVDVHCSDLDAVVSHSYAADAVVSSAALDALLDVDLRLVAGLVVHGELDVESQVADMLHDDIGAVLDLVGLTVDVFLFESPVPLLLHIVLLLPVS
jgi:hypothetical protein